VLDDATLAAMGHVGREGALVRFTLRDYRPDDFASLWQIDQSCFPPGIAYSRYELSSYIRRQGTFTLIAETCDSEGEGNIIGFLVAEADRRRVGHIITIDVLSSARKQGLGSSLLEAAETRLRSDGCRSIYLETAVDNATALAFYKRHNYSVIQTVPRYYSNGVDALVLEKNLLHAGPSG
jgi:[ribosomal protein S18]-alanine N-acetyltransferase